MKKDIEQISFHKKGNTNVTYLIGWDGETVFYQKVDNLKWFSTIKTARTKEEAIQIGEVYIERSDV